MVRGGSITRTGEDLLVTATCLFAFPSSITSITSSGLETKRSVQPWQWNTHQQNISSRTLQTRGQYGYLEAERTHSTPVRLSRQTKFSINWTNINTVTPPSSVWCPGKAHRPWTTALVQHIQVMSLLSSLSLTLSHKADHHLAKVTRVSHAHSCEKGGTGNIWPIIKGHFTDHMTYYYAT